MPKGIINTLFIDEIIDFRLTLAQIAVKVIVIVI